MLVLSHRYVRQQLQREACEPLLHHYGLLLLVHGLHVIHLTCWLNQVMLVDNLHILVTCTWTLDQIRSWKRRFRSAVGSAVLQLPAWLKSGLPQAALAHGALKKKKKKKKKNFTCFGQSTRLITCSKALCPCIVALACKKPFVKNPRSKAQGVTSMFNRGSS